MGGGVKTNALSEDLSNVWLEPHVKHAISLVQRHVRHVLKLDLSVPNDGPGRDVSVESRTKGLVRI